MKISVHQRPLSILITTGIFPPDIGGPATYVPQIAKGLAERGHQVRVLTTSEPEDMTNDRGQTTNVGRSSFVVRRLNRRAPLWYRPLYYMWHILRHGRDVDVIYANGVFLETALANLWLRKPLVMKVVGDEAWERATRRGWTRDGFEEFQRRRQSWIAELFKRLRTWAVRRADKVIVPSQYLKRFVVGWGVPEERCVVIYNAVEEDAEEAAPAEVPPLPESFDGKVRLITVGRLVPWKGVDRIIRVLPDMPQAVLTVVGDGPCREEWETLARTEGVAERVWFARALPKPVLRRLLREHDVFVLASSYEGLPHIVLEAMQAGLAVVATAVGGTPEVVRDGENGVLVPAGDEEPLGQVLHRVVASSDLRERLHKGANVFTKSFTFPRMLVQTEKALAAMTWKGATWSD